VLYSIAGSASLPPEWQEARVSRDSFALRRPIWEIHFVCVVHGYTSSLLELQQKHGTSCLHCTQTCHKTVWFRV